MSEEVVRELDIVPEDEIWEIGPGGGFLTETLVGKGKSVRVFEIDRRLEAVLSGKFPSGVEFHWGDFMDVDLPQLLEGRPSVKVCGNLPYYCGTAMIRKLLGSPGIGRMVFVLQEEVSLKAAALPGDEDYGFLSAQIRLFAEIGLGNTYPPGAFDPSPKVSSRLLRLDPLVLSAEERTRRLKAVGLLSKAFSHRRKMLLPLLGREFHRHREPWENVFARLEISPQIRIEKLALALVLELADNLD